MAMATNKYSSKTKNVTCGHCNKTMLLQNFSAHNKLKHPGMSELVAGDTKITGFFASTSRKRTFSDCEDQKDKVCSADIVKPDANNVLGDISTGEELPSEPAPLSDKVKKLNEILERVKDIQLTIASDKGRKLPPLASSSSIYFPRLQSVYIYKVQ